MRSLHDVTDDVCVKMTRHEQFAAEVLYDVEPVVSLARTGGPPCLRCYVRGVALHPVLGMCESCCEHEGVR